MHDAYIRIVRVAQVPRWSHGLASRRARRSGEARVGLEGQADRSVRIRERRAVAHDGATAQQPGELVLCGRCAARDEDCDEATLLQVEDAQAALFQRAAHDEIV